MLHAIGLNLIGGFATYLVAKIASSGKNTPVVTETVSVAPAPPVAAVPIAPTLPPAVKPAPVESKAPPPAPPPPVDRAPTLPTPPTPPPASVVLPPVVIAPPAAKPPPVVLPPVVVEAPRPAAAVPSAPVEVAPPPPPPAPPPDVSATLPTPRLVPDGPEIEVPVGDKYAAAAQRPATSATPVTPSATPAPGVTAAPPAGFDPAVASMLAPALAKHIAAKQYDFNRAQLETFQTAAGLTADGVYGNDSWGALLYFTSDAPRALYKPSTPTPYAWGSFVARGAAQPAPAAAPAPIATVTPAASPAAALAPESADVGPVPPPGFDPKLAKSMAKNVAKNIDANKSSYSRPLVRNFQTAAGLEPDGIYGGGTRRALIFYGVERPAQPLFKPTTTPAEYLWAPQASKVLS